MEEARCPARERLSPLASRPRDVAAVGVRTAAHRLVVVELCRGGPDDPPTGLAEPETEVDVVEGDPERLLVQAAERVPGRSPDDHARAGHRRVAPGEQRRAEVAGREPVEVAEGVAGDAPDPEHHTAVAVLDPPR